MTRSSHVMTRSTRPTQATTAKRKIRAAASALPEPASMKFLVFEDTGGGYHWTVVAASGETLVQSASFATYEDAKQAARIVHRGAASASFEHLAGDIPPVDLAVRRETRAVRDDQDAERWLDEDGSFNSEAVRRWPAGR
jgi:uncharacterized protein YegP (UPF0339 family)